MPDKVYIIQELNVQFGSKRNVAAYLDKELMKKELDHMNRQFVDTDDPPFIYEVETLEILSDSEEEDE